MVQKSRDTLHVPRFSNTNLDPKPGWAKRQCQTIKQLSDTLNHHLVIQFAPTPNCSLPTSHVCHILGTVGCQQSLCHLEQWLSTRGDGTLASVWRRVFVTTEGLDAARHCAVPWTAPQRRILWPQQTIGLGLRHLTCRCIRDSSARGTTDIPLGICVDLGRLLNLPQSILQHRMPFHVAPVYTAGQFFSWDSDDSDSKAGTHTHTHIHTHTHTHTHTWTIWFSSNYIPHLSFHLSWPCFVRVPLPVSWGCD